MGARGAQACVPPTTTLSWLLSSSSINLVMVIHILLAFTSGIWLVGAQEHEGELLLKFKSSLTNATHPSFSTWNLSTPPCSGNDSIWLGVICTNGYVFGLRLEHMELSGQIDVQSLSPIRFLRALSFMGNSFEGSMPDWKEVGALKALFLSNNRFSGQIAVDAFKGMNSLKKVHLANNSFTGPLPASLQSRMLLELRLDNNRFSGRIPTFSSENLMLLSLANNQLDGPIPAALSKFGPASFAGNKALCGKPLETECKPVAEPPDVVEPPMASTDSSSSPRPRTPYFALIVACVAALLLLVILMAVLRNRRQSQTPQLGRAVVPSPPPDEDSNHHIPMAAPRKRNSAKKSEQKQSGKLTFVSEDRGSKFEYQDLMRASAEVLGSGTFGAAYKAVLVDGEAVVVKRFKRMNHVVREDFHEHMRRLGRLKHPNLLPLVAYLYRKEEKLLVFDYVPNGSLATHLHGKHKEKLNWGTRLKIIKGVGRGLMYLQNELPTLTIPHGHLKSSNVLLDKEFNPLLMDYALSPVVNSSQVHQVLFAYKSPEYANLGRIYRKTDVWCLGALILETLTGKYPAQGSSLDVAAWIDAIAGEEYAQAFDKEMEGATDTSRTQMEKLLQIGMGCCQVDTDKRWDLEEALRQIELIQRDDSDHILISICN